MVQEIFSFFDSFYIPKVHALDILEMLLLVVVIYQVQKRLRNTRAWVIIKGIAVLVVIYLIAVLLHLVVIETIFKQILSLSLIAIIFLFEPEIKKFLESLGNHDVKRFFEFHITKDAENYRYSDNTIKELVEACEIMSEAKTGALIIIEMDSILNEYMSTGINVDSAITSQMLIQIFEKNTPLHDGALIIKEDRLASATCYLPLSNNQSISKGLGTRHRAGIGLSELTDAIVIIVSEETGAISVVLNGKLEHNISSDRLDEILQNNQEIASDDSKPLKKLNISFKNIIRLVGSVILSLFIWISIINIENPITTKQFTVPVTITNEESLSSVGKTYEIVDGNYVDVKVTATRSLIDEFSADYLVATADLEKLSYTSSVPVDVSLVDSLNPSDYSIDTGNATVALALDEITELSVDVQIEPVGTCREGYFVSKLTTNKSSVNIVGAKSIIKTVDKAVLQPSVYGLNDNTAVKCNLVVYDKNGDVIDASDITLSDSEYIVNIDVLPTKEVPINVNTVNSKTNDYELKSLDTDIDSIIIAGSAEDLSSLNSIDISIDLRNESISESYIKSINLEDFLPEGMIITGDSSQINVTMLFDIYPTKDIKINSSSIKLNNLGSKLSCDFSSSDYTITVKGASNLIKKLDVSALSYSLDLNGLSKGVYSLPLKINGLPEGVVVSSDVVVEFTLK